MNPLEVNERIERTRALLDAGRLVDAHHEFQTMLPPEGEAPSEPRASGEQAARTEPRPPGPPEASCEKAARTEPRPPAPPEASCEKVAGTELALTEAVVAAQRARLRLALDLAEACAAESAALIRKEQLDDGLALYDVANRLQADIVRMHDQLGDMHRELFQLDDAIHAYRAATRLAPPGDPVHDKLREAIDEQQRPEHVLDVCRQKVRTAPDSAAAHLRLANALREFRQLDEAIESYERALELAPNAIDAINNLAVTLKDAGRPAESFEPLQKAAALAPESSVVQSNLLYATYFLPKDDPEKILFFHQEWGGGVGASPTHSKRGRGAHATKMRIGYVSPDFRSHCQSFFTIPLLSAHDPKNVEVFCYSDVHNPDGITDRIRNLAHHWRDIHGLSDQRVAQQIRDDQIDVLMDLTMHMARCRPMMFAQKPAPVQVTWLAYPGTTGSPAIDFRLSDPCLDPPGSEIYYTEQTIRLPYTFWCYDPLIEEPQPPAPLPALFNRHITFGCLNNICKVSDDTLSMWRHVLHAMPTSRLILLAPQGSARQRVLESLQIDPQRIEFVDYHPRPQYLELYNRIDLCLDTFPYNGHTTTLDGLWMGVPVVSLCGRSAVSRAGLSLMSNLGMQHLVAHTAEEFATIALQTAGDWRALSVMRSELRERMMRSPLMDSQRFARDIESAYRVAFLALV